MGTVTAHHARMPWGRPRPLLAAALVTLTASTLALAACTPAPAPTTLTAVTVSRGGQTGRLVLVVEPDGRFLQRSTYPSDPALLGGRLPAPTIERLRGLVTSGDIAVEAGKRDGDDGHCPTDGDTLSLTMGALHVGTYLPCETDLPTTYAVVDLLITGATAPASVALPTSDAPAFAGLRVTYDPVGGEDADGGPRGWTLDVAADGTATLRGQAKPLAVTEVDGLRLALAEASATAGATTGAPAPQVSPTERCARVTAVAGGTAYATCGGSFPRLGDLLFHLADDHFDL